jgi:2'-5' RNA ligase
VRLFVAVDPPPTAVTALDAALGERDERLLRWAPPDQWHLTLVFCGEVAETDVDELRARLARAAARATPFSLQLIGGGTFPKQAAKARVVWVGVGGDVPALTRLAERCAAAARRTGIEVEDRRYRPHLTVARARREAADARAQVDRLADFATEPWRVASLRLVKSTVGSSVTHETLEQFALASPADAP